MYTQCGIVCVLDRLNYFIIDEKNQKSWDDKSTRAEMEKDPHPPKKMFKAPYNKVIFIHPQWGWGRGNLKKGPPPKKKKKCLKLLIIKGGQV
jgi:hypothetical protein